MDNLGGREEDKGPRTEARFKRVDDFLVYLQREEDAERKRFGLDRIAGLLGTAFVSSIRDEFEQQRAWIRRRIQENRERYLDDLAVGTGENPFGDEQYDSEEDVQLSLPEVAAEKD